jgi:hypothetical protein
VSVLYPFEEKNVTASGRTRLHFWCVRAWRRCQRAMLVGGVPCDMWCADGESWLASVKEFDIICFFGGRGWVCFCWRYLRVDLLGAYRRRQGKTPARRAFSVQSDRRAFERRRRLTHVRCMR